MIDMERVYSYIRRKKAESEEKDSLIETLRNERDNAQTRLNRLSSVTFWAELDSGKAIAEETQVRYFGKYYTCTQAHTKALLRSPLNGEYWKESE